MNGNTSRISEVTRRNIFDGIVKTGLFWNGREDELQFLGRLYDLVAMPSDDHRFKNAWDDIWQHCINNPNDWPTNWIFEDSRFELKDGKDELFLSFLCKTVHPEVRPETGDVKKLVNLYNGHLEKDGYKLEEVSQISGFPIYGFVSGKKRSQQSPKNLIFASPHKPDIRLVDAINNDIEIVSNADKVLVYDKPIHQEGLTWEILQSWWSVHSGTAGNDAKKGLYRRLVNSLPQSSPPQKEFFVSYFKTFKHEIPSLPALLPEVWLHWDPKTVKERGFDALLRFRMDFLMLLPNNVRVVIEIDGKQHYETPDIYGDMMRGDRDLRLAGYEVFRFGANELMRNNSQVLVAEFFDRIFSFFEVKRPLK